MWSTVSIAGKPCIGAKDLSGNPAGWQAEFCERVRGSLIRSGIEVSENGNCLLLFGDPIEVRAERNLIRTQSYKPALFAVCTFEEYDHELTEEILSESFASFAIAQQSPVTRREAGLFFLKFFTELHLHSSESITGKMVWFSASKAKELLRKRRYTAKFRVKC